VLSVPSAVRIWLAIEPVNLRMSFRGLSGIVRARLQDDPLSGHLFCFVNSRRTMMKLLLCDQTGFWIFHKRLSRGTFELPAVDAGTSRVRVTPGDLAAILEGIDLASVTRRKRHHRPLDARGGS
jgi:transposase